MLLHGALILAGPLWSAAVLPACPAYRRQAQAGRRFGDVTYV